MASHISLNTNFKLGPLRGLRGSISSTFKDANIDQQLGVLLQFIFEELIDAHYPIVKRELFTLVGLQNTITKQSIGFTKPLDKSKVSGMTELVLLFSMSPRPRKQLKDPNVLGVSDVTQFLGIKENRKSYTDYLMVSLRTSDLSMQLDYNYLTDLTYLYNAIGSITKNFVKDNAWWRKDSYFPLAVYNDLALVESMYADKHIKDVIESMPYNLWAYNRNIWRDANNLLCKYHFSERFCLYYILSIHEFIPESLSLDAEEFIFSPRSPLFKFVEKGILHFTSQVKTGSTNITPNVLGVLRLLYYISGKETSGTELSLEADFKELVVSLNKEHFAERKQMLLTTLSSTQTLASKLIYSEEDNVLSRVLGNLI